MTSKPLLALAMITLAACRTTYAEGGYTCTSATIATDCPPNWYCHTNHLCYSYAETPDGGPMPDAGPNDAGTVLLPDGCALATYYLDGDGDHYGVATATMQACETPTGYAAESGDCDDGNAAIHPTAPETCNGMDDDCSGMPDDGGALECVQNTPTSCTTVCGSLGMGVCSAVCAYPVPTSCTPPSTETLCDGRDDDCDGLADESLIVVGPAVDLSSPTVIETALVATSGGYVAFGVATSSFRVEMQPLSSTGDVSGSPVILDAAVAPGVATLAAAATASGYVLAWGHVSISGSTGPVSIAVIDGAGGLLGAGPLTLPSGYTAANHVLITSADASIATVYAALTATSTGAHSLWRLQVSVTATPSVTDSTELAADLLDTDAFDVVVTSVGDYVVYEDTTHRVQLVRRSTTGTAAPIGTVMATGGDYVALAMNVAEPTVAVSATNPLGIALQDGTLPSGGTAHFVEVRGISPFVVGTLIGLPSSTAETPGVVVQLTALQNGSSGVHGSHWFVASGPRYWEVEGDGGAPTGTMLGTPDSRDFAGGPLAISGTGMRVLTSTSAGESRTRSVGCP